MSDNIINYCINTVITDTPVQVGLEFSEDAWKQ